jgi:CBS domain-containing protein
VLRAGVWAVGGNRDRATIVSGWAGRVVAVIVALAPFWLPAAGVDVSVFDLVFLPILAFFLYGAASASIRYAQFRSRLPSLDARRLARRTLAVPGDLPLAEAVRRAQAEGAGGIATLDSSGQPAGIVNEQALTAVPEERRPWLPVSAVARSLEPGLVFSADLTAERLLRAMQRTPATEYLLVEGDGTIYGVLSTADVDRLFSAPR